MINKDRFAARKKAWAQANKEKVAAANKRWREKNRESLRVKQSDYHKRGYYNSQLMSKFGVLRGEILVGNDSKELLEDFSELIKEMHDRKLLDDEQYNQLVELI